MVSEGRYHHRPRINDPLYCCRSIADDRFKDLHTVWAHLASTSRASTTENSRRSAMRLFAWFCFTHSLLIATPHSTHTHSLPRSGPGVPVYYLFYLYKAAYMLGTIKQYLSTTRTFCRERKQPDPMIDPTTELTAIEPLVIMRAIKRSCAAKIASVTPSPIQ